MVGIPFEKGKSGNPNGRPKADSAVTMRLREMAPEAIEALYKIASTPTHKDHFKAVENILNRVLGMPKQPIGLADDDDTSNAVAGSLAQVMAFLDGAIRNGKTGNADDDGVASASTGSTDPS